MSRLNVVKHDQGWVVVEDGEVMIEPRQRRRSAIEWATVQKHLWGGTIRVYNEDGTIEEID